MKKKSLLIALIAILAMTMTLFAGCGGSDDGGDGSAAGGETYTLKMGGVDAPDDVSTQTMEKFAELVSDKTGGAVTVETYPAGQLGNYDEMYQEIKRSVHRLWLRYRSRYRDPLPALRSDIHGFMEKTG